MINEPWSVAFFLKFYMKGTFHGTINSYRQGYGCDSVKRQLIAEILQLQFLQFNCS